MNIADPDFIRPYLTRLPADQEKLVRSIITWAQSKTGFGKAPAAARASAVEGPHDRRAPHTKGLVVLLVETAFGPTWTVSVLKEGASWWPDLNPADHYTV